jgi:hypothetical protein
MRLILFFALVFTLPIISACNKGGDFAVEGAYAYTTTKAQRNGAVFMVVNNQSNQADRLVSAQSDVAERVELHTHIMDGDMMMMRKVDAYDLPASQSTTLKPTGHHIMLMGLKSPLKQGESFSMTLMFEKHAPMTVDVQIKSMGAL